MKKHTVALFLITLMSFNIFGQDVKTVANKYFQSVGGKEIIESILTSSIRYRTFSYQPNNDTTYTETKQKIPNQEIEVNYNSHHELNSQSILNNDSIHLFLTRPYLMNFSSHVDNPVFIDPSVEILSLYKEGFLKYSKTDSLNGSLYHVLETNYSYTKPNKAFYFDDQSGLLIAQKANNITFYKDYRRVKNLYCSFLREKYLDKVLLSRIIYESIELNIGLSKNDFKPRNFDTTPLRKVDSKYNRVEFVDTKYSDSSFQDLIKSFNGKIMLIDIWASWCGPCKYEFTKYSDDLYEFLAEKNISLLFISIDKPGKENVWRKELEWFNVNGYHLRANKNLHNSIIKEISEGKAYSIPRYILINENGEVLSNNLGKPSSTDFRSKINKLLN